MAFRKNGKKRRRGYPGRGKKRSNGRSKGRKSWRIQRYGVSRGGVRL